MSPSTSLSTANTMATLGTPERVALIKENLTEVLDFKIIEDVLAEGRHPKIYWGTISSPLKAIQRC